MPRGAVLPSREQSAMARGVVQTVVKARGGGGKLTV